MKPYTSEHFFISRVSELKTYLISWVYHLGKKILLRGPKCFIFLISHFSRSNNLSHPSWRWRDSLGSTLWAKDYWTQAIDWIFPSMVYTEIAFLHQEALFSLSNKTKQKRPTVLPQKHTVEKLITFHFTHNNL